MKNTAFVLMAFAEAVAAGQLAPSRPVPALTPEQTLDRRAVGDRTAGDLEFSPDGSRLLFSVGEPVKAAVRARAIWRLDVTSGQLRQLTFSGKNDTAPRWSPDGESVTFVSDRDGAPQLYRLSMRGGEAEKLTDRKEAVGAYRWSPDGTRIALLMAEPKPEALQQREREKDDGRVVDKDNRRQRVWVLDVASRTLKQIGSGGWRIAEISWTPDGSRLIAAASEKPEADQWNERIYSIDPADGRFTQIAAPRGPLGELALSPDGKTIAYVGARVDGPEAHDLYLQPIAGGAPQNLTAPAIDRPISQPRWIDNQSLAVNVANGVRSAIAMLARDGRVQMLDGVDVNPSLFARSSNGTFAYVGETATLAPELWIKPPNAPARAVTAFNDKWASIPVVAPEFVKYKSADGVEIEAALLRPEGAPEGAPHGDHADSTLGAAYADGTPKGAPHRDHANSTPGAARYADRTTREGRPTRRSQPSALSHSPSAISRHGRPLSSSTAGRRGAGATASSRGGSCSSRAGTPCCIRTSADPPATASASSR